MRIAISEILRALAKDSLNDNSRVLFENTLTAAVKYLRRHLLPER